MKIVTFEHGSHRSTGALIGEDVVLDFAHRCLELPVPAPEKGMLGWLDLDDLSHKGARMAVDLATQRGDELVNSPAAIPLSDVRLLSPIPRPGKVICIGLNYRDHAEESGLEVPESPLVFSKFSNCVVGPGDDVVLPRESKEVDYEAEFGVVIGRRARHVSKDDAMNHVLGYCNVNDVSARDFQFADGQWQRGKSCESFCPVGPYLVTADEIADPHALRIQFRLNGDTLQDSSTNQLIFDVPTLVAHLSSFITLEPGDLISTGTPPGVGFARKPPVYVQPGDVMEVEVEGLGVLTNKAIADA